MREKDKPGRELRRRLPVLLLIPLGLGLQLAAAFVPGLADAYATSVYPPVSRLYGAMTGWIPFSVAEVLVVVVTVALIAALVRTVRRVRSGRQRLWDAFVRFEWRGWSWLAVVYFLFVVWGLNYQRTPLATFAGFDRTRADPDELRALAEDLVDQVNALRTEVREDDTGVMRVSSSRHEALSRTRSGFGPAAELEPAIFRGHAGRAKGLYLLATPMSVFGADGIFLMWTGEPSVNMNVPDPALPFDACHEVAHLTGWAREDEANFVGYLACANHPDSDFRYAGALAALRYVLGALRRSDPEAATELAARLSPAVRRDQEALAAYSRRYRSRLQSVAGASYDLYLKSQGQKEGRASYGMMVRLLLAYRKARAPVASPTENGSATETVPR